MKCAAAYHILYRSSYADYTGDIDSINFNYSIQGDLIRDPVVFDAMMAELTSMVSLEVDWKPMFVPCSADGRIDIKHFCHLLAAIHKAALTALKPKKLPYPNEISTRHDVAFQYLFPPQSTLKEILDYGTRMRYILYIYVHMHIWAMFVHHERYI